MNIMNVPGGGGRRVAASKCGVEGGGDQRDLPVLTRKQTCSSSCQLPVPAPARQRERAVDDRQRKKADRFNHLES